MLNPVTFSPHSLYATQQQQQQQQHHQQQHQLAAVAAAAAAAAAASGDPYRSNGTLGGGGAGGGGGSGGLASDVFPATPYTPVSSLFMSPVLRSTVAPPHTLLQQQQQHAHGQQQQHHQHHHHLKRPVTHVTSSKFAAYTTIYNLEAEAQPSVLVPKVRTQMYQTSSRYLSHDILLRRIVNVSASPDDCKLLSETLRQYRHPNLVTLSNLVATDEFVMGSSDVIMEYRFITGAKSLYEAFLTDGNRATEGQLWSMACQLVGLLRSFHEMIVPVRGLHWSKLLYVEATGRFYYTGLGLLELLDPKPLPAMAPLLMQQDIQALGLILLQLASHSLHVTVDGIAGKQPLTGYSQSFCELIKTCLEGNTDAAQLCHALGERMSMEVGQQEGHCDYVLSQCNKEVHNGRLMRLLMKMNFVLEYVDDVQNYTTDSQRHALRLFNQFVFNQVDEQSRVHLDWGHAYHCLNKLDCGSDETIQLIGNDGSTTVLVVSYADLRSMLENLFQLLQQQITTQHGSGDAADMAAGLGGDYSMSSPGMI